MNSQFAMIDDTILAISTPLGPSPLAVMRLSGPDAVAHAVRRLVGFEATEGSVIQDVAFDWEGSSVPVRATTFRAPRSYTGEDMVELAVPGSIPLLAAFMRGFLSLEDDAFQAPRPAQPGEFTLRTFLNGKMDLAQAEAVGRLIHASGAVEARAAYRQIRGALGDRIDALADGITKTLALVEAAIDFPDEEIPEIAPTTLGNRIDAIDKQVRELFAHCVLRVPDRGNIKIVVLGLPNAGKSSLVNAVVGRPVALVSGLAGTTRDPVRGFSGRSGRQLEWVDLAGLEESSWLLGDADPGVESDSFPFREAIQRLSEHELRTADVVVWVIDGDRASASFDSGLGDADRLPVELRERTIFALSKIDVLDPAFLVTLDDQVERIIGISAHTGAGMEALLERIVQVAEGAAATVSGVGDAGDVFLLSPLQQHCLTRCCDALDDARLALTATETRSSGGDFELAAVDLREAVLALEPVLGRQISERVLGAIFGQFCVGK